MASGILASRKALASSNCSRVSTRLDARFPYAKALILDDATTLDDLREAVTTLEDTDRIARRVLGGAHPTAVAIEQTLRAARQLEALE